jgi:hypothetical protein
MGEPSKSPINGEFPPKSPINGEFPPKSPINEEPPKSSINEELPFDKRYTLKVADLLTEAGYKEVKAYTYYGCISAVIGGKLQFLYSYTSTKNSMPVRIAMHVDQKLLLYHNDDSYVITCFSDCKAGLFSRYNIADNFYMGLLEGRQFTNCTGTIVTQYNLLWSCSGKYIPWNFVNKDFTPVEPIEVDNIHKGTKVVLRANISYIGDVTIFGDSFVIVGRFVEAAPQYEPNNIYRVKNFANGEFYAFVWCTEDRRAYLMNNNGMIKVDQLEYYESNCEGYDIVKDRVYSHTYKVGYTFFGMDKKRNIVELKVRSQNSGKQTKPAARIQLEE